ncbi:MAG: 2'-5' RNA ligase family protein [Bacteroidia bacterium]|nr:2'-5' RNA ligase family protein [Bacteroidia bacterium]
MFRRKMTLKKYFLAIVIPEPAFSEIEALKTALMEKHGLKGALRSPAHITLHRPFEWKEEKEEVLINTLTKFNKPEAFTIELKDYDFFEPRVVFINVTSNPAISELHFELSRFAKEHLRLFNEAEDLRGFHPHVTVAFRDLKKPKFYELQREFSEKKFEHRFKYSGFSLLKLEKTWNIRHTFNL